MQISIDVLWILVFCYIQQNFVEIYEPKFLICCVKFYDGKSIYVHIILNTYNNLWNILDNKGFVLRIFFSKVPIFREHVQRILYDLVTKSVNTQRATSQVLTLIIALYMQDIRSYCVLLYASVIAAKEMHYLKKSVTQYSKWHRSYK